MLNLSNLWFVWSKQSKIKQKYELDGRKVLGLSKYGQVIKYKEKSKEATSRAVRVIPKNKILNNGRFKQEINQIRHINNPIVAKLIELYEDDKNLYFVMEQQLIAIHSYCDGGALIEKILLRFFLKQSEAREIFTQIVNALIVAHRCGICQRDLKVQDNISQPGSFHFINQDINDLKIQLIDLGFQLIYVDDYLKKQNNFIIETSRKGKLYYTAPEIFFGKLTEKSEVWTTGVILHVLLTGTLPFEGKEDNEIYSNIQNCSIALKIDGKAGNLISQMLQPAEKRIQLFQVLKHEWINQTFSYDEEKLNIDFISLKSLAQNNFLQKIMRGYVADQVKFDFSENLGKIFDSLDINGSGFIKIEYISKALEKPEFDEITKLMKYVVTEDGTINYLDFMNQILEKRIFVDEERIYNTFKMFDLQNKGKISKENLHQVLSQLEQYKHITKQYCGLLISEVDRDNDGEIEYLEFIEMFFKRA